jgi:hypothetical protein
MTKQTDNTSDDRCHAVDPDRLAAGEWSHTSNRQIGEGDIHASYSADRIGMGKPVRKPFRFAGGLWVCVGCSGKGAEAYRLSRLSEFVGETFDYGERVRDGQAGRSDPLGFYHGMRVCHAGQEFILTGPAVRFVAGEREQLSLF